MNNKDSISLLDSSETIKKLQSLPLKYNDTTDVMKKYNSYLKLREACIEASNYFSFNNQMIEIYFDLLTSINNFLNLSSLHLLEKIHSIYTELKILQFEYVYNFYKKFFPENFLGTIKAAPMIILKFMQKKSDYLNEFESLFEFNSFEVFLIEDFCVTQFEATIENIADPTKSVLFFHNLYYLGKFSNITDTYQYFSVSKTFAWIIRDQSGFVRYLVYFLDILNSANVSIFYNKEKIENTKVESNEILEQISLLDQGDDNLGMKEELEKLKTLISLENDIQIVNEKEEKIHQLQNDNVKLIEEIEQLFN